MPTLPRPPDDAGPPGPALPVARLEAFSDGVFAIAITLLVLELHVPGRGQVFVLALEHLWPGYLGYLGSFSVSFLPFTTAIVATYLFASFFPLDSLGTAGVGERVAVVLFGLNLSLAALMIYRLIAHAVATPGIAASDPAEEELQAFAAKRRAAVLLQTGATIGGATGRRAVYLAVSVLWIIEPFRRIRLRRPRQVDRQAVGCATGSAPDS
jgi:uncharacterized membrane protein